MVVRAIDGREIGDGEDVDSNHHSTRNKANNIIFNPQMKTIKIDDPRDVATKNHSSSKFANNFFPSRNHLSSASKRK